MRKIVSPSLSFLLPICFFILLPNLASAEITHPYTIDEKSQVLFGDSVPITSVSTSTAGTATTTYYGLENYHQDYVGGFAHFTFTYTHSSCCYASYPPFLYITNTDPSTTPTSTERMFIAPYPLSPYWGGFGEPTDWYFYDIRFDATGFTVVVKQAGQTEIVNKHTDVPGFTETDWVALANHYLKFPLLPYSMSFIPVPISATPLPQTPDPVIIVPGIAGTELYNGSDLIWLNLWQIFTDVNDQFLTENLSLDINGNSVLSTIQPKNIIEEIKFTIPVINKEVKIADYFRSLVINLEANGYQENQNLFFFPYDWRLDLNITKDLLKQKIEEVKAQTGKSKVSIIAHSMGGLLTKEYLNSYGKDSINKIIFVGTPHLGAPKAGKILLEGDRFSIPWLEEDRIRDIAENSPALHELLPDQTYFNQFQGYFKKFSLFSVNPLMSYTDTKNFFLNDKNKNPIMFQKAEDFYNQNLDNFDFNGIETYNIVGCKTPTQAAYSFDIIGGIGQTGYTSGDGTVPMVSADYINIPSQDKFYVKDGDHAELPSANGVRDLILEILNNNVSNLATNVSNSSTFCNFKGKKLTWHSPVEVQIYDANGHHTGPIENNAIEYGVPGIDYDVMGHNKFIFLPTDEGQQYRVEAKGLTEGTFDLSIAEMENGQYLTTQVFNDVPVSTSTTASFAVNNLENNSIELENQGIIKEVPVDATLNGEDILDLVPPETAAQALWIKDKNSKPKKSLQITLTATDNQSGVLETAYSLDEGKTFNIYLKPILLNKKTDEILFYSIDKAGNDEDLKKFNVEDNKIKKCLNRRCLEINDKHDKIERGVSKNKRRDD